MKVVVKVSGFYGGQWHDAGVKPIDMPDAIARAFLPPHGDQLALPAAPARKEADKPVVKTDKKKAG